MNPMDQAERGHPQNLLEKHPIESSMERREVKDLWQVVAAVRKSSFVKAKERHRVLPWMLCCLRKRAQIVLAMSLGCQRPVHCV